MAIVQKDKLLVDYDVYKQHGGFVIPQINDEDQRNGIDTPEKKYEAWSRYTQNILNSILSEKLDNVDYDLNNIKPMYQKSLIKIMITRLLRAFENDELIPRDSQIQLSQQGGINYSSSANFDAKTALYSFFNGGERLMIERSGLLDDVISAFTSPDSEILDNEFTDGVKVNTVAWGDKQDHKITINGVNTTVTAALDLLGNHKLNRSELEQDVKDLTGVKYDQNKKEITPVDQDGYIKYNNKRLNKDDNELAQVIDIKESEARNRKDIVSNQRNISELKTETNELGNITDDYLNSKADFVKIEDIKSTIKKLISGISWIENGNNLELDLSSIDMSKFASPNSITIKSSGTGSSIYIFDSYNDGKDTGQTINVDNKNEAVQVEITDTKAIIKLMTQEKRQWWITNMKPVYIEQIGQAVPNVDQIARDEINKEKIDRKNGDDKKINKQLVQNIDFSTWADLLNLIEDDDFVNISLVSGENVFGHITDKGAKSITISGTRTDITDEAITGKIVLNDQWQLSGGSYEIKYHFTQNADNLTANDTSPTSDAYIGKGYKGNQFYGYGAKGHLEIGKEALGVQSYAYKAHSYISFGNAATSSQDYGPAAEAPQSYGYAAKASIKIGGDSTGPLSIHMSEKGIKNKIEFKQNVAKEMAIYVDGHEQTLLKNINKKTMILTFDDGTTMNVKVGI